MSKKIIGFSKLSKEEKIEWICSNYLGNSKEDLEILDKYLNNDINIQSIHDTFSENTLSNFYFPFSVAPNFLINNKNYCLPMVIEESSVIAAASNSAKFWYDKGGFRAKVISSEKIGQIHFLFNGEFQKIKKFIDDSKSKLIDATSKISSKIDLLNNLIELFDTIVVGGAMANTFLYANKVDIGISFVEKDLLKNVRAIQTKASKYKCKLILPVDAVCSKKLTDNINIRCCEINNVLQDHMILDVGEKTTKIIKDEILKSQMIIWNGPLGAFEYTPFDQSSVEIANTIKKYSKDFKITSLAGGGDTISLIKSARAEDGFTYISKAGGAFLEWLEGKESPGVRALKENTLA